jgi:protein ImuB
VERQLVVWCPGLLEPHERGREARAFARVLAAAGEFSPRVEVLRPGVCAVPTRGPSRYFGGDETLAHLLVARLASVHGVEEGSGLTARSVIAGIGVADGLFAASLAARSSLHDPDRAPVLVVPGGTPGFLSPWPVEVLHNPELANLLCRLGIRTLGAFAELPSRHVLARFGADGATCQAVAAGAEDELPGLRLPSSGPACPSTTTKTGPAARRTPNRQAGFFGGAAGTEARAAKAVAAVQQLLGAETVFRGRLQGGRGPADRARLVPWGEQNAGICDAGGDTLQAVTFPRKRLDTKCDGEGPYRRKTFPRKRLESDPPWPGQVPTPSPAVVFRCALAAELLDACRQPVGVTNEGLTSAVPVWLSIAGDPWSEVAGWAGPWPSDERWWSKRGHRRQARMQVTTTDGAAYLLARRNGWWVEGIYD